MRRIQSFKSKDVPQEPDFSLAQTTIDELSAKTHEILRREILNLMIESSGGKLSPTSAKALVDYVKLLGELKEKETEELRNLSEDHLQKIASHDQS